MTGPVAPLWMPFALLAAIVVWIFVWYFVVRFLAGIGEARYERRIRVPAPAWKEALSYALGLPALFIAIGGGLALGVLLVAATGSIVAN